MKKFFLLLSVLIITVSVNAQQYTLTDDDVEVYNGVLVSCSYDFAIKDIIIPDTLDGQEITEIGNWNARPFYQKDITSVQLPSSLRIIGDLAFTDNKLKEIDIPEGVETIGFRSFSNNGLIEIKLPNTLVKILGGAFSNNNLTILSLPSSTTRIFNGAFSNNDLSSINIPVSVNQIGSAAFNGNQIEMINGSVSNVIIYARNADGSDDFSEIVSYGGTSKIMDFIPATVTTIGYHSFSNLELTSVVIPNTVKEIAEGAFIINSLTNVMFEANSNIESIGIEAFGYNPELTSIILPTHASPAFTEYTDINGLSYKPGDLIDDFSLAYNAVIPYTLTDIDVEVVRGRIRSCSYDFTLKDIIIPDKLDGQTIIGIGGFSDKNIRSVQLPSGLTSIASYAFAYNSISRLIIPNTVIYIGAGAFTTNKLQSINIPNSVMEISEGAFANNYITSVIFEPNSNIQSIGKDVFRYQNSDLISIKLPTHVNPNFIEYLDTDGNVYLAGNEITDFRVAYRAVIPYTLTDADVVVSDGVINSCSYDFSLKDIIIPEVLDGQTVTGIGKAVFRKKFIFSVQLPSTLKVIEDDAFYDNLLSTLAIPGSVTSLGNYAFRYNNLTDVIIPNSVKIIGTQAFYKNHLVSITIPNSVTEIGSFAFSSNKLKYVNIPNSNNLFNSAIFNDNEITTVNENPSNGIFYARNTDGTEDYSKIVSYGGAADKIDFIPNSVSTIGKNAFAFNNITDVVIPETVTAIEGAAFQANNIGSITIPCSVTSIGIWAFQHNSLINVNFEADSKIIIIESGAFSSNSGLASITLPSNSNSGFTNYYNGNANAYYPGDALTDFNTHYYLNIPYTLTDDDVVVVDGVIESCSYNFSSKIIVIPESLDGQTIIGIADKANYYDGVFYNKMIADVQLPSTLKHIGDWAFLYNNLSSLTLPEDLMLIGNGALYGNKLTNITIPNSVTSIRDVAYYGNKLTHVTIPNCVTFIGWGAFRNNFLVEVILEDNSNVITIVEEAFIENDELNSIKMPTHANVDFIHFKDTNGNIYNPGDEITDFYISYEAQTTDSDIPLANAGANQTVKEGELVTLDGSASSDPDADELTYKWTATEGITLSSETTAKPTFTAPEVDTDTDYVFTLTVNDGTEDSAPDQVTVTVENVNKAPVADAGEDITVSELETIVLNGSASWDADDDNLTYQWILPEGFVSVMLSDSRLTVQVPLVNQDTTFLVQLIVNDGELDSEPAEVKITVRNTLPLLKLVARENEVTVNHDSMKYRLYKKEGDSYVMSGAEYTISGDTVIYLAEPGTWIVIGSPVNSTEYLPTYVGDVTGWDGAEQISIQDGQTFYRELNLIASETSEGSYSISGFIYQDSSTGSNSIVKSATLEAKDVMGDVMVYLFNGYDEIPLKATFSDKNGYYRFDNLPEGNYFVQVNIPGYSQSEKYTATLNDEDGEEEISFVVNTSSGVVTDIFTGKLFEDILIFPNPTTGGAILKMGNSLHKEVEVVILNSVGAVIFQQQYQYPETVELDLSQQVSGMYLVKIKSDDRQTIKKLLLNKQ